MSINGIIGLSTIEMLRNTIENANGASNFLNGSYKKGMQAAGILQYVGDLTEPGKNTLRTNFEKMSSGLINTNRIAVMPLGVTYQPLQLKLTDAQFLENTRLTIQQLTAAFGIKPHQVNDQTKTSYASTSEANREFYTDTMLAILTMYEQELSYKTFMPREVIAGYYTKFNADVILRADPEKRYAMYKDAIQNMLKTPNECRAMEEDAPLPGGDTLYGNAALAPATLLAEGIAFTKGGVTGNA
jgi:HK97 family phage portal protein